jgi:3-deoxy-7-phosphoheptulonate synthase
MSTPSLDASLSQRPDPRPRARAPLGPLPTPAELAERFPLDAAAARAIAAFREQTIAIVHGRDDRALVVVGPCSIHDPEAALEYAARLAPVAERHARELCVVMRVYLEKPRSSVGWKGLISDPHLDGRCDVRHGLGVARELMTAIAARRVPMATELLDGNLAPYLTELLTWAAIGARTSESQPHRELASTLPFAIGFKNGTDGRVDGAVNGLVSAAEPHRRLAPDQHGRIVLVQSDGNPHCHLTLRGGTAGPNFDRDSVQEASRRASSAGMPSRVLVDCSHGNSGKNYENQVHALGAVAAQIAEGSTAVLGVMVESHLVAGRQALGCDIAGLRYGQSVTDGCVDFDTTERLLETLARAVRTNRARRDRTPDAPRGGAVLSEP